MSRKYVMLHEGAPVSSAQPTFGGASRRSPRAMGAAAGGPAVAGPRVETELMAPSAARELVRARKVAAIAPVMPMGLIAPVRVQAVTAMSAAGTAWGVDAVGAAQSPFDGTGIVVAVLDTGIDPNHPAFQGVQLERKNFTNAGEDDEHGHGTHCAGTIFGRAIDGMRIGVAPGVTRAMIGKVLGGEGGGSDKIAEAMQWAVNGGAHVISMSLGIDFPGYVKQLIDEDFPAELATTIALEGYRANILLFERLAKFVAARELLAQPCLLIAAAGNESRRERSADFEVAVSPPAVSDGFISVAALGRSPVGLDVASFSNTGARISGPGVDIVSARAGGGLVAMDGTSMATPHVAGVAALWAQKLVQEGGFRMQPWNDRLVGSGTFTGLRSGIDPTDVGVGLVQAPRG